MVQRGICSYNGITAGLVTPGKPIDLVQSQPLALISPKKQRVLLLNTASGLLLLGAQRTHLQGGGASLCDRFLSECVSSLSTQPRTMVCSGWRVYDTTLHTQSAHLFMYKRTINGAVYTTLAL